MALHVPDAAPPATPPQALVPFNPFSTLLPSAKMPFSLSVSSEFIAAVDWYAAHMAPTLTGKPWMSKAAFVRYCVQQVLESPTFLERVEAVLLEAGDPPRIPYADFS